MKMTNTPRVKISYFFGSGAFLENCFKALGKGGSGLDHAIKYKTYKVDKKPEFMKITNTPRVKVSYFFGSGAFLEKLLQRLAKGGSGLELTGSEPKVVRT